MDSIEPLEPVLLEAALKLAADQRGPYLDRACAGDLQMRQRVQLLLDAFGRAGEFMQEPAAPGRNNTLSSSPAEKPGDRIGRYKLLEQIGEGGCGLVYVAEQEEPVRRRVALKVIKLGMDTKQVIARFDAERQALALMDHPNIAKVLDAGATEKGRPYFVMELVRGIKITDYCDQQQLSPRERLDLFIQVCRAVQHAHQKGIIHRDIKPSNILVGSNDGVPVPKVIDFGIAKATQGRLTDQTVYTAFEQFIGTPAYMSPEQAEISLHDIDTRTDIYSLGVLLYELLTGKTPFDAKELLASGYDAMRKTIREKEPARPSTRLSTMMGGELTTTARERRTEAPKLIHLLRGDLDWIVMKCLEKDRTRRYETANGLAMDIQRHLSNEPVVARPQSPGYRFQKMVRRNQLAFTAAAGVAAALLVGLIGIFWQWRQAERNHQEAEANLYAADMNRAEQALGDGDLVAARGLLKRHADQTELHGFEWRYLWKQCVGDFAYSFSSHSNTVLKVVFSPDGNTLAVLQANGTVRLLNVVDRTERECWSNVIGLSGFTRDGQELVVDLRESNSVRLVRYDIGKGRITASFTNESRLGWLPNLLPDGRTAVIAGAGKELSLVDVRNGALTGKVQLPSRFFLRWGPVVGEAGAVSGDGRWVFALDNSEESGTAENLSIRELGSGKILATYRDEAPDTPKSDLGDRAYILRLLPGGTTAVWCNRDGFLRRWQWTDAGSRPLTQPGHRGPIWDISCSPDGRRVATAGQDQTIRLWNAEDLREVRILRGHTKPVYTVAFSPDGQWLASGGDDGSVKLWNLNRAVDVGETPLLAARHLANRLVFAPDGRTLALGTDDDAITTISMETGRQIGSFKGLLFPDRFTSDGSRIIGYAGVGNVPANKVERRVPVPTAAYPWTHDVSPDGRWLLRSHLYPSNGTAPVELVDVARGAVITNFVPSAKVEGARFTRDGRTVLASLVDGQLDWWELMPHGLAYRKSVQIGHFSRAMAISPDGATVAIGGYSRISLVDYRTGAIRQRLFGHSDDINGLDFSPDGGTLASSSMNGTIKLWNLHTMQEVCTIPFDVKPAPGKELGVEGVVFAPDGNSLWAFSRSGALKSWQTATPEEVSAAEQDAEH